jgi:hypothetical protein
MTRSFILCEIPLGQELLHIGVVGREAVKPAVSKQVGTTISDMREHSLRWRPLA